MTVTATDSTRVEDPITASAEALEQTIAQAEEVTKVATAVKEGEALQADQRSASGIKVPPTLTSSGGATGLAAFAAYSKGSLAPWWLHEGVCRAWGFSAFATEIRLITVSENATYAVIRDGEPFAVLRVSQPGYVGGPAAVESEMAWLSALHNDVDGVNVVDDIPTASGSAVAMISDGSGTAWACVCTSFVEGVVLENLPDPSSFYHTIGHWTALFHQHSRAWEKPEGFERFTWDVTDMVGEHPRWGRWEDKELTPEEFALFEMAQEKALSVISHVSKTADTWGLIHADLRPSNIIAAADGTLTVIDFDDSGFSYFLYDYASALSFVEHEPYAPDMAKAWMAGYQEVTPLSQEQIEVASALSMIRRLQMVGWTTNHYPDALPDGLYDAQVPGTVKCARNYLESSTWLLD